MHLKSILDHVELLESFGYKRERLVATAGGATAIEVEIEPRGNGRPICSGCGKKRPGYDRLAARRFEFVPLWNIAVFFVYAMRRVECPTCGVLVERVPWADGKEQLTTSNRRFLARWAKRLSWQGTADAFNTTWDSEFRDGCVDLVGSAIELAQAMLDKLAQDVLGQNQLYRRRQETVSQQLLANAREERCRQQHVGVEDHPHEMASRMSSSQRKPAASARHWSCSRFWRHRATARARSRMSSATSSAERHCLRPNSSSVWPESSGSLMVSDRAMSAG